MTIIPLVKMVHEEESVEGDVEERRYEQTVCFTILFFVYMNPSQIGSSIVQNYSLAPVKIQVKHHSQSLHVDLTEPLTWNPCRGSIPIFKFRIASFRHSRSNRKWSDLRPSINSSRGVSVQRSLGRTSGT